MVQYAIVSILFLVALGYLVYLVIKNFRSRGCPSGCGSCGIDFSKIQKDLAKKGLK